MQGRSKGREERIKEAREHTRVELKFKTPKKAYAIIIVLLLFVIGLGLVAYTQNSQVNSLNNQINSLNNQLISPNLVTITGTVTIPSDTGPADQIIMTDASGNTYYGSVNSIGQFSINVPNEDSYTVSIRYYQNGIFGIGAGYTTCNAGSISVHSTSSSMTVTFSCS